MGANLTEKVMEKVMEIDQRDALALGTDTDKGGRSNRGSDLVTRVRNELVFRNLEVVAKQQLTPGMVRVVLGGEELNGFTSLSPDDHVKIFITDCNGEISAKRDYTPRHYDAQRNELTLDFVVHDSGPATQWAKAAAPGDSLQIAGPRGSQVISNQVQRWLLIGDESALPAIARRLEELPATTEASVAVVLGNQQDQQQLARDCQWLVSEPEVNDAQQVQQYLDQLDITPNTFVWLAGESGLVKQVREYLLTTRNHDKRWLKASGYWKKGAAETSEKFE